MSHPGKRNGWPAGVPASAMHSNVARLLAGCDGTRTLRQLLQEMAGYLGVDEGQAVAVVLPVVCSPD